MNTFPLGGNLYKQRIGQTQSSNSLFYNQGQPVINGLFALWAKGVGSMSCFGQQLKRKGELACESIPER